MSAPHSLLGETGVPIELPAMDVVPDAMQIFMFSAVTWNRHHVHYSKDAAVSEGLPDVVVQRALIGNFLARALTNWLAERGEIRELTWKVVSSATPGRRLRCQGRALSLELEDGRQRIGCELRIVNDDDQLVASGTACVELF
ncbi:MAG TPA: hypothetical protein VFS47_10405 [Steroidobacteraceae bacterium]|nr:hypothetical protein [Steroidobacteraceae bacterium]